MRTRVITVRTPVQTVRTVTRYREHLNASDYKGLSAQCYYHWFEPALEKWLDLAKLKIVQRVKKSLEMSTIHQGEMIVKHSTSSNDVVTALCHVSETDAFLRDKHHGRPTIFNLGACFQMKEFWKHLAWPDLIQSYNFVLKLLDVIFLFIYLFLIFVDVAIYIDTL